MSPLAFAWLARPSRRAFVGAAPPATTSAVVGLVAFTISGLAYRLWNLGEGHDGYVVLAIASVAILVVPVGTVSAATARMQARHQEDKLSTLRLLGLSSSKARLLLLVETALPACIGTVVGWSISAALTPLMSLVPLGAAGGHVLGRPPWPADLGLLFFLVGLAVISALIRLHPSVAKPMSLNRREHAPAARRVQVIASGLAIITCLILLHMTTASWGAVGIMVVLVLSALVLMAVWGLLGPSVIRVSAQRLLRRNYTPLELVAARALLEDPAAAWRQVSPLALMSFLIVPAVSALGFLDAVTRGPTRLSNWQIQFFGDIRSVVLITTLSAFVLVACSSLLSQIASIAERRDLYLTLTYLGAPVRLLQDVQLRQVMVPLKIAVVGPSMVATIATFPLTAISVVTTPWSAGLIIGCLAMGMALVRLGSSATNRYLRTLVTVRNP